MGMLLHRRNIGSENNESTMGNVTEDPLYIPPIEKEKGQTSTMEEKPVNKRGRPTKEKSTDETVAE